MLGLTQINVIQIDTDRQIFESQALDLILITKEALLLIMNTV